MKSYALSWGFLLTIYALILAFLYIVINVVISKFSPSHFSSFISGFLVSLGLCLLVAAMLKVRRKKEEEKEKEKDNNEQH